MKHRRFDLAPVKEPFWKRLTYVTGALGSNEVRRMIVEHLVYQLNIPPELRMVLTTAMGPRSLVYDDRAFKNLCNCWVKQQGLDDETQQKEIDAVARKLVSTLECKRFDKNQIAVSLFPAFGYFASREDIPDLHKCTIF
jgi:hypothetical protein